MGRHIPSVAFYRGTCFLVTILRRSIAGGSMRSTDCHLCICLPVCHRKISNSCGEITSIFSGGSGGGKGGRGRTAARCCTLRGALVFDGRKFGILAFALHFFSASLYVFLIYSVHLGGGWRRGGHHGPLPRGGKTLAPPLSGEQHLVIIYRRAFIAILLPITSG